MNSPKRMRISAIVIIGLYAVFLIFASNRETWGPLGPFFTPFAILVAAGTMFLAWKRPLAGVLVVLFLSLLFCFLGVRQAIEIYGANFDGLLVIMAFLVSPLLLAGVLLLAAHRRMK